MALVVATAAVAGTASAARLPAYGVVDLGDYCNAPSIGCVYDHTSGTPPAQSYANAVNDAGQVVGASAYYDDGSVAPFVWQNGTLTKLPPAILAGFSADATAINAAGVIAGWSNVRGFTGRQSTVYGPAGWTILPTLGWVVDPSAPDFEDWSRANDVNDSGAVVGASPTADVAPDYVHVHAYLYSHGVIRDLGTLAGPAGWSDALGVNRSQTVVGRSSTTATPSSFSEPPPVHAFRYDHGAMHDLGTLGGTNSEARRINDAGVVVGDSNVAGDAATHAFVAHGTRMIDLGTLGTDLDSTATDVNEAAQVVGCSGTSDPRPFSAGQAFVWNAGGRPVALASLLGPGSGWTLHCATGINNFGEIVGYGISPSGLPHGFLLDPVLAGDAQVEAAVDSNPAGRAEAFSTRTTTDTPITAANVYLDASSTAAQVHVGFYGDNGGHPGQLLGAGTISSPVAGAWNHVSVPPIGVPNGTRIWIGILAPVGAGTIRFRDNAGGLPGTVPTETSAATTLTALPSHWSSATRYPHDGPMSAYGG